MKSILNFGMIVVAIFSVIFLLYTNGFLMKRRKKEIGLYNILGMEKRHIMKVLFFEMMITASTSIIIGILSGIAMSKLVLLLLIKMVSWKVVFGFEISGFAIIASMILFGSIFVISLLTNLGRIHLTQPIELLKGGQHGEREPKSKWLLTLVGVICLGSGYYIAMTTERPLAALSMFFVAVLLVIAGTYALFTAGSVFVLKLLKRNKKFYYQTRHFTSVSGLIYRMKQNAVGLANICVLSTIVLVMISSTSSLYIGLEDAIRTRFPRDIIVQSTQVDAIQAEKINAAFMDIFKKQGITPEKLVQYRYIDFFMHQKGNAFTPVKSKNFYDEEMVGVSCIPLSEYNRLHNQSVKLQKNEVFVYHTGGTLDGEMLQLGKEKYKIIEELEELKIEAAEAEALIPGFYVIMPDEQSIELLFNDISPKDKKFGMSYNFSFDTDVKPSVQIKLAQTLQTAVGKNASTTRAETVEASRNDVIQTYGGLLFIGIFLGIMFIMATVMIIYYKQISEGYEDRERFEIMRKVGMSKHEVKRTIRSQVLIVFFLPLATSVIHIAFAFKLITKMLVVLNLTNVPLFAGCTAVVVIVFAIFYVLVYSMTARVYYKLVS